MDKWKSKKRILIILAHPDDPEFFCGGTIAKWSKENHEIHYALLTKGEKGINDHFDAKQDIVAIREREQALAGKVLGIKSIHYLNLKDGMVVPSLKARKQVIEIVRKIKPNIVVTCDPTNYYLNDNYINHPDHRAAGQIVVDAVFPGAGNELYFPELIDAGYYPHKVEEVWISLPKEPNTVVNVTDSWEKKVAALENHRSQIGDIDQFREYMRSKAVKTNGRSRYEESFHRIIFRT